ncbi:MAG: hypothetical protein ABT20_10750 [Rubrivivax sp. SCN 70-15]|nr:MAG: hypothetical protein ABT20_10750 [Rubrivivax sp. SCN 70-15]
MQAREQRFVPVRLADGDDRDVVIRNHRRQFPIRHHVQQVETDIAALDDELEGRVVDHVARAHEG